MPWNEPGIIAKMLDAGAHGIIVPMVNSADEARDAVQACRYPPARSRSWGPTLMRQGIAAELERARATPTADLGGGKGT